MGEGTVVSTCPSPLLCWEPPNRGTDHCKRSSVPHERRRQVFAAIEAIEASAIIIATGVLLVVQLYIFSRLLGRSE